MTYDGEYYGSAEQCFWEGPCSDPSCEACWRFHIAPALARCDREIAAIKAEALAGNPDVDGIMLALHDWRNERRMILGPRRDPII